MGVLKDKIERALMVRTLNARERYDRIYRQHAEEIADLVASHGHMQAGVVMENALVLCGHPEAVPNFMLLDEEECKILSYFLKSGEGK